MLNYDRALMFIKREFEEMCCSRCNAEGSRKYLWKPFLEIYRRDGKKFNSFTPDRCFTL